MCVCASGRTGGYASEEEECRVGDEASSFDAAWSGSCLISESSLFTINQKALLVSSNHEAFGVNIAAIIGTI